MVKFRKDCPSTAWLDIGHLEMDFEERHYDESVELCKAKGQMMLPVKKASTVEDLARLFFFCDLKFWWIGLHFTKNIGTFSDGTRYKPNRQVKVMDFRVIDVEGGSSHVTCKEGAYIGEDETKMFHRQLYRAECSRFVSATICVSEYRSNPDRRGDEAPTEHKDSWLWQNDFPALVIILVFIVPAVIIILFIAYRVYVKKKKARLDAEKKRDAEEKEAERRGKPYVKSPWHRLKRDHESTEKFEIEQDKRRQAKQVEKVRRKRSVQDNFYDKGRGNSSGGESSQRNDESSTGNLLEQFLKAPVFFPTKNTQR